MQAEQKTRPLIAVSSYPMYDFVRNVVEDSDFEVWIMLPPGLNAHSYEPTPQDLVKLRRADVFVYTTDYFELWANKTIQSLGKKDLMAIMTSATVGLIEPDDETLGPVDPHTWLSPKNAKLQASYISKRLSDKYPSKKDRTGMKTQVYLTKLEELDRKYERTAATCRHREMFVSHAAFGYLSRHYKLKQIPVIKNFDPQGEVSLADLVQVIEAAKARKAGHIFFEDFISPKLSEAVAREINGTTALFSPMEAYAASQLLNDSYIAVMERNLNVMKEALKCE